MESNELVKLFNEKVDYLLKNSDLMTVKDHDIVVKIDGKGETATARKLKEKFIVSTISESIFIVANYEVNNDPNKCDLIMTISNSGHTFVANIGEYLNAKLLLAKLLDKVELKNRNL